MFNYVEVLSFFRGVVDVFVKEKRDKHGRRFGFVRYKGVKDERKLVDLIIETWAGMEKFIISKAKFNRVHNANPASQSKGRMGSEYHIVPGWQTKEGPHHNDRPSYVGVARCGNLVQVQAGKVHEEELSWLSWCLFAEVKDYEVLNDLGSLLEGAGFLNVKVKYVGGLGYCWNESLWRQLRRS